MSRPKSFEGNSAYDKFNSIFREHLKVDLNDFDVHFDTFDHRPNSFVPLEQTEDESGSKHFFCISLVGKMRNWEPRGVLLKPTRIVSFTVPPVIRLHGSLNYGYDACAGVPNKTTKDYLESPLLKQPMAERDEPTHQERIPPLDFQSVCSHLLRWELTASDYPVGICVRGPARGCPAFLRLGDGGTASYCLVAKEPEQSLTYDIQHECIKFDPELDMFQGQHGRRLLQKFITEHGKSLQEERGSPENCPEVGPHASAHAFSDIAIESDNDTGSELSWEHVDD